ncbi:hypothetical protein H2200_011614 [Cladophialophora chaetospira]|uniref:Uncharacterized protein n=1 Tax=Cladophialophora chaetospira TaxID=386627 RepID=A0AA38WZM5_9EURO|nr:hypothetical protein H2200_011614 [Cladophialophora chaetospira]
MVAAFQKAVNEERFDPHAKENNDIVRMPRLTIGNGQVASQQPTTDGHTFHVAQIGWRDPWFRMPNYNVTEPRENPMDQQNNVSPKNDQTTHQASEQTGIMNPHDSPLEWVDADLRPIDFLENHYDEMNDRSIRKVPTSFDPRHPEKHADAVADPVQNGSSQQQHAASNEPPLTATDIGSGLYLLPNATQDDNPAAGPPGRQQSDSDSEDDDKPHGPQHEDPNDSNEVAAVIEREYLRLVAEVQATLDMQPTTFGNRRIINWAVRQRLHDDDALTGMRQHVIQGLRSRNVAEHAQVHAEQQRAINMELASRPQEAPIPSQNTNHDVGRILFDERRDDGTYYLVEWGMRPPIGETYWQWLRADSRHLTQLTLDEWVNVAQDGPRISDRARETVDRMIAEFHEIENQELDDPWTDAFQGPDRERSSAPDDDSLVGNGIGQYAPPLQLLRQGMGNTPPHRNPQPRGEYEIERIINTGEDGRFLVEWRRRPAHQPQWGWLDQYSELITPETHVVQFSAANVENVLYQLRQFEERQAAELQALAQQAQQAASVLRAANRTTLRQLFLYDRNSPPDDALLDQFLDRADNDPQLVYDTWRGMQPLVPSIEQDDVADDHDADGRQSRQTSPGVSDTDASQPDEPQTRPRANVAQGRTQAGGAAPGGAEPPPSPPPNLDPFARFAGRYRRKRKSHSSDTDTSESESTEPSPDRQIGPGGATTRQGETVPASQPHDGRISTEIAKSPSPQPSHASNRSPTEQSSTPDEQLTLAETLRQEADNIRNAGLPTTLEAIRRHRPLATMIAHTRDERHDRDMFLIRDSGITIWVHGAGPRAGTEIPLSLPQWRRLLMNAVIRNEHLFTEAQAGINALFIERSAEVLERLRPGFTDGTNPEIVAQSDLYGEEVFLLVAHPDVVRWVNQNGDDFDPSERESDILFQESHVFDDETFEDAYEAFQQRSAAGARSNGNPPSVEESESSPPAPSPVREQLTRAEQDKRRREFVGRVRTDGIEVTNDDANQYLAAAGWHLPAAFDRFYADQGNDETPETTEDNVSAPESGDTILAATRHENRPVALHRLGENIGWVWADTIAAAELTLGVWERLLENAHIFNVDAVESVWDNYLRPRQELRRRLEENNWGAPEDSQAIDAELISSDFDVDIAYNSIVQTLLQHIQANRSPEQPGDGDGLLNGEGALDEPASETPAEIKSEPSASPEPRPAQGSPAQGSPAQGSPAQGSPAQGSPSHGRSSQGSPEKRSPEPEEDEDDEPAARPPVKRRKLNNRNYGRHTMELRERRHPDQPAPPAAQPPANTASASTNRRRGGGQARASGAEVGSPAATAKARAKANKKGKPQTTKGKPRSKDGVQKKTKQKKTANNDKKKKATEATKTKAAATKKKGTASRQTQAQTQPSAPVPASAPVRPHTSTRARTRSQTHIDEALGQRVQLEQLPYTGRAP